MSEFLTQSLLSLVTGLITGIVFAAMRLPIPSPPVLSAVFGIAGITLGYMLYAKLLG